tara:strand:+ start:481 stop:609 length:129 start_codon:yes stop_codon:yes gene_type:complete
MKLLLFFNLLIVAVILAAYHLNGTGLGNRISKGIKKYHEQAK